MSRTLPPQPHIDVLKKQARQLLSDYQSGQAQAIARVRAAIDDLPPGAAHDFCLRHAQQLLAHEYGFSSWQALSDHVDQRGDRARYLGTFYGDLADRLVDARASGKASRFGALSTEMARRMATGLSESDAARAAVAAAAGCDNFDSLAEAIAENQRRALVTREEMGQLERLHADFVARLGPTLSAVDGVAAVTAEIAFVDRTSFGEIQLSIGLPSCTFRCRVEGLDGDVMLDLGPRPRQALGGASGDALPAVARAMLADLAACWAPVANLRPGEATLHTDPWGLGIVPLHETCVLFGIELSGGAEGLVSLAYPAPALAPHLGNLAAVA